MLKVEDKLVVALAKERIFLCEWVETQFRPQPTEKQRKKGEFPEVPEQALKLLRLTFKSLSNSIKNSAMRDEDSNLMVKAWYSEHFDWANAMTTIQSPTSLVTAGSASFSQQFVPWGKDRTGQGGGGKGGQKRVAEEMLNNRDRGNPNQATKGARQGSDMVTIKVCSSSFC